MLCECHIQHRPAILFHNTLSMACYKGRAPGLEANGIFVLSGHSQWALFAPRIGVLLVAQLN